MQNPVTVANIVLQQVNTQQLSVNELGQTHTYVLGDVRANEQLNLLVMHTIWMNEHNRVADELARKHRSWNDEKLFQEARRIVIAEYQHIIYSEWLPKIIGPEYMDSLGLWPLTKGYSDTYDGMKC